MKSRKSHGSAQNSRPSVSKGLRLRIDTTGSFRTSVSHSSGEFELTLEIIQLLSLIQKGASTSTLAQRLQSELKTICSQLPDQAEIIELIADLKQAQVLIDAADTERSTGIQDGFADDWIQWAMLADKPRCKAYERAIHHAVNTQSVVVDVGAGSGLLSLFALQAGARHVTAIEETGIAASLRKLKSRLPTGLRERLDIQNCNSSDAQIPAHATLIVSELFGNDPFQEGLIPTLRDFFSRLQSTKWSAIPRSCAVYVQLAHIVDGPLANRIGCLTANHSHSTDIWQKAIEQIKSTLSFKDTSFAYALRANDYTSASALEHCYTVALAPPPPQSAKRPNHSCALTASMDMSAPVVLLFFRAHLSEQQSISNITGADDCCEHWSPLVLPLNRAIKRGEVLSCTVGLSEDWCKTTASVRSKTKETLGSRL